MTGLLTITCSRFIRLVSERCDIPRDHIVLPHVMDVHREADHRAVKRIFATGDAERFFNIIDNGLRGGPSVRTKTIARTNAVNNLFSWRVVRQDRPFMF